MDALRSLPTIITLMVVMSVVHETRSRASDERGQDQPEPRQNQTLSESDWATVPELEPVWLLEIDRDGARVILNRFADSTAYPRRNHAFPVGSVRVSRLDTVVDAQGRFKGMRRLDNTRGYVPIRPDGTVREHAVCWNPAKSIKRPGQQVGFSLLRRVALFTCDGHTEVCDGQGNVVSVLPERVKWSRCFDVPERIVAVAVQDLADLGTETELSSIVVLDYEGHILYETDWTGCDVNGILMGRNPNVIWLVLDECAKAGEYILRVDEGEMKSVRGLPRTGRRFSSDARHVLVNDDGLFKFFDAGDPGALQLLWQERVEGKVRDVAVSEGGEYVAFSSDWGSGQIRYIYLLSGRDGSPVGRFTWTRDRRATGPLAFLGSYLFAGMGFGFDGTPWNSEFIYLFDLSSFASAQ